MRSLRQYRTAGTTLAAVSGPPGHLFAAEGPAACTQTATSDKCGASLPVFRAHAMTREEKC